MCEYLIQDQETTSRFKPSPHVEFMMKQMNIAPTECQKLVPNLEDKTKYVLHYRNLKLYLELGLKLKCVHF